jgi:hypothetical protein
MPICEKSHSYYEVHNSYDDSVCLYHHLLDNDFKPYSSREELEDYKDHTCKNAYNTLLNSFKKD